eukprot:CAMPEP_0116124176 /NCGR_PEP_ID=MMETSP0329-20121206/5145_1 /TAXON_ID=697910 /ORGANISM="Pseudo-nitzschia arenysensis, Strain B593" /LENGTH=443 /DNA_ID=CAMNT_0003618147 /DNA_START=312 /DNA_END=1643 /DNA_ORIENTATION=-
MSTAEDETKTPTAVPPVVPEAKMEDASTAETANPVVATEALAAAAAAAVNAAETAVVPQEPIVLASPTPAPGRVSLLSDVDGQGKRRFFPRVKHLIGNKEWEDFLTQVLQCIEEAGAPETAAASHKANNAWYKAFDLIYGGVAREYSIPTGKNRYHKFKDKILEVWVALESQAPGENHCRELAMEQYERYKRACAEASKNGSVNAPSVKASKTGAGQSAGSAAYNKLAGGKRSYNTAMGGGASFSIGGSGSSLWKNLDEKKVLEGLSPKLQSLVHLKQLSKEMVAGMPNRAARKGIEEHSKKLDGAYLEALNEYLKEVVLDDEKTEEEDVEMATDEPKETNGGKNGTVDYYDRCLTVAFLYRYASTLHEQKLLADAYAKYTEKCVTFAVEPAVVVAAAAATEEAVVAPPSTTAEAPPAVSDEATAAAAAAAAMEESFPAVQEI